MGTLGAKTKIGTKGAPSGVSHFCFVFYAQNQLFKYCERKNGGLRGGRPAIRFSYRAYHIADQMRRSSLLPKPPGVERPLNHTNNLKSGINSKPRFRKTMSAEFSSEIDSVGVRTQNLSLWCEKNGMMSV